MASASISLSLATREARGAALFEMHSVLGSASDFRLRRFSTVGVARGATTIFRHRAFAVACIASFLATRSIDLDGCFVVTDLRSKRGRWERLLPGFLAVQVSLGGRPVDKGHS